MFIYDYKKFRYKIKEVYEGYDIDKVYVDKVNENRCSFKLLDKLNIEIVIKI